MHTVGAKILWQFPSNSFVIARILVLGIFAKQRNLSTVLFISNLKILTELFPFSENKTVSSHLEKPSMALPRPAR